MVQKSFLLSYHITCTTYKIFWNDMGFLLLFLSSFFCGNFFYLYHLSSFGPLQAWYFNGGFIPRQNHRGGCIVFDNILKCSLRALRRYLITCNIQSRDVLCHTPKLCLP